MCYVSHRLERGWIATFLVLKFTNTMVAFLQGGGSRARGARGSLEIFGPDKSGRQHTAAGTWNKSLCPLPAWGSPLDSQTRSAEVSWPVFML